MTKNLSKLIIILLFYSCSKEDAQISGCMDITANNYNNLATVNDGSCDHSTTKDINILFTQTVNNIPLIMNNMIYTNFANKNYNIQKLKYLISDIKLHVDSEINEQINEVHFINASLESTLSLNITEVPKHEYNSLSFTMGLDSTKNITDLFLNRDFFPSFVWPEPLGGGYHYMQLEGQFDTTSFYNTHTGGTNGLDFSFKKSFPISFHEEDSIITIHINMEITNWYQNPQLFDFTSGGIMGNINSQSILRANGIQDVFSVTQPIAN